ncbi:MULTISPECIES: xanthine dehydrogenase family protein molybdopterin-binding subunit [Kordiimonas]|jgi:CO/xanthine dehydrogenase Mo-binding subunit|uniref:xanthine dehydrogenase family protein molybdopterin-binding subunit n=1 Tax=Kordiimonas TaxID=288021 RepID=UPI00257F6637|nr:molybdopterin cofactor-binding domain-containing protein [Kordiimonas sp. UBA4487]
MKKSPSQCFGERNTEGTTSSPSIAIGPQSGLSRRSFIKNVAGAFVTVNVFSLASGIAARASEGTWEPPLGRDGWMGPPGVANARIDGYAKVTGQKIYARDYHVSDMEGWPGTEAPVMIIRAINVDDAFIGLDMSMLPPDLRPERVIYGEQVEGKVELTNTIIHDQHLDQVEDRMRAAQKKRLESDSSTSETEGITLPGDFMWPFIVPRGAGAAFYGQPVAFLIFKDRATYLGAKKQIQFVDSFQQYGAPVKDPLIPPLSPLTNYVRVAGDGPEDTFSYSQNGYDDNYNEEANNYRRQIEQAIADNTASSTWKAYGSDFSMQAMDPMFMEPESGLGWYDASTKTLNLVVGTQSPDGDIGTLLGMFEDSEISVSTVNLFSCYPGGGFGGRDSSVFTLNLGIAAVMSGGSPVRLAYDRFEQFQSGLKRHACTGTTQVAFDTTGRVQALTSNMQFDSGGRRNLSPYVAQLAGVCAGGSYNIPLSAIFSEALYSTNVSGGSQRGFGGPQAYFIIESLFDEAARDFGVSPFDIRRTNITGPGDRTVVGGPITQSLQFGNILDMAEADPIWQNRAADRARWAREGLSYGVGFAVSNQAYGTSGDGVLAAVAMDAEGNFTVRTNAVDMGNGSATTLAVVIGETLGANAERVELGNADLWDALQMQYGSKNGSWDDNNWTPKSVGSSSACLTAFHQVHAAVESAKALFDCGIFPAAQALWGAGANDLKPSDTAWVDGQLTVKAGGFPGLTHGQLASQIMESGGVSSVLGHAYFQETWAKGTFSVQGTSHTWGLDGIALTYGANNSFTPNYRTSVVRTCPAASSYVRTVFAPCGNLIGVTVDPRTGDVVMRASASFLNAGKIHVEGLVSGQSQGGVAMAMGWTLLEDMPPGPEGPASGDWNLNRYFVAKAKDVPLDQRLITLTPEGDEKTGRGIAEAVMCSVAPAISNAIYDATGARMRDLPITPQKMREALNG